MNNAGTLFIGGRGQIILEISGKKSPPPKFGKKLWPQNFGENFCAPKIPEK